MGKQGDIILSKVSEMRNVLVPLKQAYYLHRYKGKPILPDNWTLPVSSLDLKLETITPAVERVPYQEIQATTNNNNKNNAASSLFIDQNEVKEQLKSTMLVFKRILVHEDSDKIFGSVSGQDIQQELSTMGIPIDTEMIQCRLKTVGDHSVPLKFGNEEIELLVRIEPE